MLIAIVIFAVLILISLVLSLLGFLGVGIIVDDHYLFAPKEKRREMDKKPYYRQSGILFLFLALVHTMYLVKLLTGIVAFMYAALVICAVAILYEIVSHYGIRKKYGY